MKSRESGQRGVDSADRIPVPRVVFDGIEAVRRSGLTNMLDRPVVAEIAEAMGFEESARWVRENRSLYARAIFCGFLVLDDPGAETTDFDATPQRSGSSDSNDESSKASGSPSSEVGAPKRSPLGREQ